MYKKIGLVVSGFLVMIFSGCSESSQIVETEESIAEANKQLEESFADSIKIGVITDIHNCNFRSPGKITTERMQSFAVDVDERKTDLNIDLGDNIRYRLEGCDNDAPEELAWTINNLKTKAPIYHVLSDHDVDDYKSFEYWKKVTKTPKTYYSFDVKNFHIIVLDTVSGDGELDFLCRLGSWCEKVKKAYHLRRDVLKNEIELEKYLIENKITKEKLISERDYYEKQFSDLRSQGVQATEINKRDAGSILEPQLSWLEEDLAKTEKEKVVIFSDHPLFKYQGKRKLYQIVNQAQVSQILENSGKEIVAVNGETHEWNEFNINGIQYYLIGKFDDDGANNWAILNWSEDEFRLEKIEK